MTKEALSTRLVGRKVASSEEGLEEEEAPFSAATRLAGRLNDIAYHGEIIQYKLGAP